MSDNICTLAAGVCVYRARVRGLEEREREREREVVVNRVQMNEPALFDISSNCKHAFSAQSALSASSVR